MTRRAFYLNNLGLPLLLAVTVWLMFDLTGLDRWISNLLLDGNGQFPLLHDAVFEKVTHKWPRILPDWTGRLAIVGALLALLWALLTRAPRAVRWLERARIAPLLRWSGEYRRDLFYVVTAFALSTMVIHYLKSHTGVYCPVETTPYGGPQAPREWFEHFRWIGDAGDGRCWPGGHASSGFTLLALYFVALRHGRTHARRLLVTLLMLGLAYGTTRVLQGWHYMSHTFWAGIFVWLTSFGTALLFYGRPALSAVGTLPDNAQASLSLAEN